MAARRRGRAPGWVGAAPEGEGFRLAQFGIAGSVAALLLATINQYGYHRDELYFRGLGQHPAWGYLDQPPATPLLARFSTSIFGDTVWGLRVPAVLCARVSQVARPPGNADLAILVGFEDQATRPPSSTPAR